MTMSTRTKQIMGHFDPTAIAEIETELAEVFVAGVEERSAAGALSLLAEWTQLSVTGTVAYTLAAPAFVGQRKIIECVAAASIPAGTVTIADVYGSEQTTWTFNAVGQRVELLGTATGWKHVNVITAGAATPAAASTLNPLVAFNNIAVDGTDDWILPSGAAVGQTVTFHVSQADNIPVGTISGLFYDEDGSADGVDIQFNAVADMATVRWNGARWVLIGHTSAAIA